MEDIDIDFKLMDRVKKGDESAFEEIVSRHYHSVYNLANRFLYSTSEAEDITQEVFLRVFRASKSYTPKAKFSTWLYTITKNLCFNELRKLRSVQILSIEDEMLPEIPSKSDSPALKLEKEEMKAKVREAVMALPANLRIAVLLLSRLEVKGKENLPKRGPLLVVSNHMSIADPVILLCMLGRRVYFMAKEELFRSKMSAFFVGGFGAIPVYRGKQNTDAIRCCEQLLERGCAVAMYPEGRRSLDARLKTGYNGSALIALRNDVDILPVGIAGTEKLKGRAWLLSRPRVTMTVGKPFRLPVVNSKLTKEELRVCTEIIMKRIAELLPVEYRGRNGENK